MIPYPVGFTEVENILTVTNWWCWGHASWNMLLQKFLHISNHTFLCIIRVSMVVQVSSLLHVWVFGCFGLLPQPKDLQIRSSGYLKLPIDVNERVNDCSSLCWSCKGSLTWPGCTTPCTESQWIGSLENVLLLNDSILKCTIWHRVCAAEWVVTIKTILYVSERINSNNSSQYNHPSCCSRKLIKGSWPIRSLNPTTLWCNMTFTINLTIY